MGRQRQRQRQRREGDRQSTSSSKGGQPPGGRKPGTARSPGPPRKGGFGWATIAALGIVGLAIAGFAYALTHNSSTSGPPAQPTSVGQSNLTAPVDGIKCIAGEQLAYHIHQHLTLYDRGQYVPVPAEIGIPGGENNATCYYWIHVHYGDQDIIHVESPVRKTYDLGNFVDIWRYTKGSTIPQENSFLTDLATAEASGQVTAYYDGRLWNGSYRSIPLKEHSVITLELGKPVVPPKPFTNWQGE